MQNRSVFITGVSSGIGRAMANNYLNAGWQVFGVSRRTPDEMAKPQSFHFKSLDLLDSASVVREVPKLLSEIQQLDLVVLNAGILGQVADMKDVSIDDLRHTMDVNLWSNKTLIDVLIDLPIQIKQVVTISSGAAVNGNRGWNGYSISKAALNMLTMLYAKENPEIHFAAVAPGLVDTAMQEQLCSMTDSVQKFPSLGILQSKRGSPEMPTPEIAADKLAELFEKLPDTITSGEFIDIRKN